MIENEKKLADMTIRDSIEAAKFDAARNGITPIYCLLGRRKMMELRDYMRLSAQLAAVNLGKPTDRFITFLGLKVGLGRQPGIQISDRPPLE